MAQVTETVARGILAGHGYTDNEVRQLAHHWLATHGQAPAGAAPAPVLHLVHSAFAEVAMAFPKAFALHKVGIADTAVREALAAPATQQAGDAADSVPAVEREQERIAFKDAHRHLELDEVPDAWGRPMFKHSHIEASWLGWIARASHGQAPATQQAGATKEHVRLVRVIADKIEDGTLFRSGIYSNKDLARFVRNVADAAAPQFPTAQAAESVPAIQGETNVQLDTDSNHSAPGQQRDMACSLALGQPVGNGSDQVAGHPSAQGDKLLTVAERNIRSFLRSATFKSESDREAALNCVDVLWEAARAADSVLEDAARYQWLRHGDNDEKVLCNGPVDKSHWYLLRNEKLDTAIDAARKQGGSHDHT